MKNKKKYKINPRFIVLVAVVIAIVAIIVVLGMLKQKPPTQTANVYLAAYTKTNALTEYEMKSSVIVTVNDGELKQTAIDQVIKADKTDGDLIYYVETVSTSTDVTNGNIVDEESSYTYYDGKYYYNLPGVRYTSDVTEDMAKKNLDNFINMISFPYDKMQITGEENADGATVYYYTVEYADISDYVKAVSEAAVNIIGEGNFKRTAYATATVENGYVTERTMYIECVNEQGDTAEIEFVTELVDTKADIEVPDKTKYANITG